MYILLLLIIYLAFIGLGLPDSLLGAAWPSMYGEFSVPISYGGIVAMIIAVGTVIASLNADRLNKKFGTGKVVAASVSLTAIAIIGFSFSDSYLLLCAFAVPYGLGAGCVDAAVNNFVAVNYPAKHMSWLHCMWGVGTIAGPYAIRFAISSTGSWNAGYRYVGIAQVIISVIMIAAVPLWGKRQSELSNGVPLKSERSLKVSEILKIPGVKQIMLSFFCYCALEQTTMLWASSYMVLKCGMTAEAAAGYASLFFIGITAGRAINGFLTFKLDDTALIRLGQIIIALGLVTMVLPFGNAAVISGLILIGLGCAPIYPSVIHSTPLYFGAEKSQSVIGFEMASAYLGTCFMPSLFGLIANHISISLLPLYLAIILIVMAFSFESVSKLKKTLK